MLQKRLRYSCSGIQSEPNPDSKSAFGTQARRAVGLPFTAGDTDGDLGSQAPRAEVGTGGRQDGPCCQLPLSAAVSYIQGRPAGF